MAIADQMIDQAYSDLKATCGGVRNDLSIIFISPGLDSRPEPPSSPCLRAWSAREGRC